MPKNLHLPEGFLEDPDAREILRVWIDGDVQRFALRPDAWDDPASWGLLLVDLARNAAKAYSMKYSADPQEVLVRIREGFDAEWSNSTES